MNNRKLVYLFALLFTVAFSATVFGAPEPPGTTATQLTVETKTVNALDVFTVTAVLEDSSGNPLEGYDIDFSLGKDPDDDDVLETVIDSGGIATTDSNGYAEFSFTAPETAGNYDYRAYFEGTADYDYSAKTAAVTVNKVPTVLEVVPKTVTANASFTVGTADEVKFGVKATLKEKASENPIASKDINFSFEGNTKGPITTNSSGVAEIAASSGFSAPQDASKSYSYQAEFAGNSTYKSVTNTAKVTVERRLTSLETPAGKELTPGKGFNVEAKLVDSTTQIDLSGKNVNFTFKGNTVGPFVTDSSGVAKTTEKPFTAPHDAGEYTYTPNFAQTNTFASAEGIGIMAIPPVNLTLEFGVEETPVTSGGTVSIVDGGTGVTKDSAGGTATVEYGSGDELTLEPSPHEGSTFVDWTGADAGDITDNGDGTYTLVMDSDKTIQANFDLKEYKVSLSATPNEGGSVSGAGTYKYGKDLTVSATPNTGYGFASWTENGTEVSTNADYTFTVEGARDLTANFVKTYTVDVSASPTEGGSPSVDGTGPFEAGTDVTVNANTADGYKFVKWTDSGGTEVSTDASYTFTINEDKVLTANYEIKTITLTLTFSGDGSGTVTVNGTDYTSGDTIDFDHGTEVSLSATADTDNAFIEWTIDESTTRTENPTIVTMDADKTVDARFEPASTTTFTPGTASGWEIVSYPLKALTPELNAVFDELTPTTFYTYQADDAYTYESVSGSDAVSNEEGYWALFGHSQQVTVEGAEVTANVTYSFPVQGWYIISTPYQSDWATDIVSSSDVETDGAGHVRLVSWNSNTGKYENVYSNISSYVLDPWKGYWVRATADGASLELEKASPPKGTPDSTATAALGAYKLPVSVDPDELDNPPAPPSTQELASKLEITAAPNPVSTGDTITFRVMSGNSAAVSRMSVGVFTSSGKQIYEGESTGSVLQWTPEGLSNGLYLYRVTAEVSGTVVSTGVQKLLILR